MDQRTRKFIHKFLHPRDNLDSVYVSRKERGSGFAWIEDRADALQRQKQHR